MHTSGIITIVVFFGIIIAVIWVPKIASAAKGKLELILEKPEAFFMPGDVVKGKVILELKKSIDANKLDVKLSAQKTISSPRRKVGQRFEGSSDEVIIVYDHGINLGTKGVYTKGEYPFEFVIPEINKGEEKKLPGFLQKIEDFGEILGQSGPREEIDWYVSVILDIPKAIDMETDVSIRVQSK